MRLSSGRVFSPYSGIKETGANVPCLKHFFPFTETSGTVVTDMKGGCVAPLPGLVFDTSLKTVYSNMGATDNPINLTHGAWHPFNASESILIMYAGRPVSGDYSRFAIGDINHYIYSPGTGFGLSDGTFHTALGPSTLAARKFKSSGVVSVGAITNIVAYTSRPTVGFVDATGVGASGTAVMSVEPAGTGSVVSVTVDVAGSGYTPSGGVVSFSGGGGNAAATWVGSPTNIGALYNGTDIIVAAKYTPGSVLTYTCYNATTGATQVVADALNVGVSYTNNVGAFTADPCMRVYGVKFYGAAIFTFQSGLPANIDTDILWMGTQWMKGDRSISPRLIGMS